MAYGVANISTRTPMTTQTPIRMASVSKSITAVGVLMLAQAGKVSLDKPIATYVPRYTLHGEKITVRQLLAMSSGIPGRDHGDPVLHGDGAITTDKFFAELNELPLYAEPGKSFDYANVGYYLLAQLIQNVSGMSYAEYVQKKMFAPAGMRHSYSDAGTADPALAVGYVHRTPNDPFLQCAPPDWSGELGAGSIISTPSDIVRFDIALMNGTLLDAAHRAELFAPATKVGPKTRYALGWFVTESGMIQHPGDFSITSTINVIYPDGTFVAEAANASNLGPEFDRTYFANQMQNAYGTTPFPLGKPGTASLLEMIKPFTTCAELDKQLFGA